MVYFKPGGRLGNLLFEYAAAISLGGGKAVAVGDESLKRDLSRYENFFHGLEVVAEAPRDALVLRQDRCNFLILPEIGDRDVVLDGFFQSERYFDAAIVRRAYAVPIETEKRLREGYGDWLSRPHITSIHVRRGDYLKLAQYHPFVGERYFRDCLAKLRESRDFIVCSDDLAWCKAFFPRTFPNRRFRFSENTSPVDDIYLCSLCQNNIMSNSSFSWWGAWLNEHSDKRMLAPSLWFGFGLSRAGDLDWSSIYAQGMEVVHNRYSLSQWLNAWLTDRRLRREFRKTCKAVQK